MSAPEPAFSVSLTRDQGTLVVALTGDLDIDSVRKVGEALLAESLARGQTVIVDLAHVDFIDSSGVGLLVTMRNDANQNGYRLEMVAPEENVTRIFRVTGTHALFHWRE
jgi:anti-sigma B factor antagonist